MILQRIWITFFTILTILFIIESFKYNFNLSKLLCCKNKNVFDNNNICIQDIYDDRMHDNHEPFDICFIDINKAIDINDNINNTLFICLYAFLLNMALMYTLLNHDNLNEKAKRFRE
jgi:hypothetical protein